MKTNKMIFVLMALTAVIALGEAAYILRTKDARTQNNDAQKELSVATTTETAPTPYLMERAPDGNMVRVYTIPPPPPPGVVQIDALMPMPPNTNESFLATSGTGTTTLKKATPLNDMLIAETGSPYASLRNARYTMWPYPGEIALKEVYLILPDVYDPIFSGYSNKQFIEFDGTKNILLYLRHKQSTSIGADARILIGSPTGSDEQDHPFRLFDKTDEWAGFSVVTKGKEVVVEVIFTPSSGVPPDVQATAEKELLRAVASMEIIW